MPGRAPLDRAAWHTRQRCIQGLLWAHVALVPLLGSVWAREPRASIVAGVALASWAGLAELPRLRPALRSSVAASGLVLSSSALVHLADGLSEAHIHLVLVVVVISLHQSWPPLLVALVTAAVYHLAAGTLAPTAVYDHPAATAGPWPWALLHASAILATGAVSIVAWWFNEVAL